jgi:hypothetical protein
MTDSEHDKLHRLHQEDYAAVKAELAVFKAEVALNHGRTERQRLLLSVILKWAEWIADGGKIVKGFLGVVVFLAGAYMAGKTLFQDFFK